MTAQAAEPEMLTLACEGTTTFKIQKQSPGKSSRISMGIIVNFTARTVAGFTDPDDDVPAKVRGVNEAIIVFGGVGKNGSIIRGSIDRVTGVAEAWLANPETGSSTDYSLKCKPTQRMF
jgi:hypothetical protein